MTKRLIAPKITDGSWDCVSFDVVVHGRGIIATCATPQRGGVFEISANARFLAGSKATAAAAETLLHLHPGLFKNYGDYDKALVNARQTLRAALLASGYSEQE